MNTIKCPSCNLTSWVSDVCKRCGYVFTPAAPNHFASDPHTFPQAESPEYESRASQPTFQPQYPPRGMAQSVTLKTGLAIASMVLGIAGLASSILLIGLLLAPVGLVLGIVALVKASKKPMVYGGQGFAIAGVVTGGLAMLFVPVIAAIAIPNLLASKRAADEGSAISGLKTLYAAEQTYLSTAGVASCGDLNALAKSGLIDSALASGTKYSYRYEVTTAAGRGCEVFATPVSASSGHRSFMIAFDGVVRGAKKNGVKADRFDPELDNRAKAREFKY